MISSVHRWNDTRIFVKQAASLASAGYDVLLIGIGEQQPQFVSLGVRVRVLPRRRRLLRWLTWLSIARLVLSERVAVVHAHDPELIPLLMLLKIIGRKTVCDIHEDVSKQILNKEWIPRFLSGGLSRALKVALWRLPRLVDSVILAEDSYLPNFPAAANIAVVRNFPQLPDDFKRDYHTDKLRMIYVGDVRIVRGVGEYVRITERLIKAGIAVECRIVGSFADPGEEREITSQVQQLGLERQICFMGRRPPEEIPRLIQECDLGLALLHPIGNYRESYPTKMFEYMAAGLPTIASQFPLWEEVLVGNDCGRVVDPQNIDEAVAAVRDYCLSPQLRESHGRNGRQAASQRYHWGLDLPRLIAVYAELAPLSAVAEAGPA